MAFNVKNRIKKRELAVIESPPGTSLQPQHQLIMATEQELEMYKKSFPQLSVHWATNEDKAKWRFSNNMFETEDFTLACMPEQRRVGQ